MTNQSKLRRPSHVFICSSFTKATMMWVLVEKGPVLLQRSNVTLGEETRTGTEHARDDWHFQSLLWRHTLLLPSLQCP